MGRHRFGMGWQGTSVIGSNNHVRGNHRGGITAYGMVLKTHILLHSCRELILPNEHRAEAKSHLLKRWA